MTDYKSLYYALFNEITDVISKYEELSGAYADNEQFVTDLQELQQRAETRFVEQ
ncbi:MAG: hypothetical protein LKG21_00565 [Ruminococcus sp.]|jgi:hypothetical protein|nr:hypothetical protein [Ruminococcus sp.]